MGIQTFHDTIKGLLDILSSFNCLDESDYETIHARTVQEVWLRLYEGQYSLPAIEGAIIRDWYIGTSRGY